MSVRYLGLLRDEARSGELTRISDDVVKDIHKGIYDSITSVWRAGGFSREFFKKYYKRSVGDVEKLVKLRIVKAVLSSSSDKESFDYRLLNGFNRVVELLRDYLSARILLTPDMAVVVKAARDLVYNGRLWRRGDIGSMDLFTAAFYYALDYVCPVKSFLIDSLESGKL